MSWPRQKVSKIEMPWQRPQNLSQDQKVLTVLRRNWQQSTTLNSVLTLVWTMTSKRIDYKDFTCHFQINSEPRPSVNIQKRNADSDFSSVGTRIDTNWYHACFWKSRHPGLLLKWSAFHIFGWKRPSPNLKDCFEIKFFVLLHKIMAPL
jgi:hypothetical protein